MGKAWDGSKIAYNVELWAECLRVLKPGGHLLAFGGTRTYHRMAVAIEDAGFEVRDSIHWCFGSGFPKSHDVSKAIDKAAGAEREVVGSRKQRGRPKSHDDEFQKNTSNSPIEVLTSPATDAARQWEGWGTALKPAHEPVVVARKPLVGTVAANVLEHGTGALNIDGCRVGSEVRVNNPTGKRAPETPTAGASNGGQQGGYNLAPGVGGGEVTGRWPANLVLTHAAECAEACAEGCPVAELDGQSGVRPGAVSNGSKTTNGHCGTGTFKIHERPQTPGYGDTGGASRFFTVTEWDPIADVPPFRYVAKPSKRERNAGLDGLPEVVAGSMAGGKETRPNKGDTRTPRQNTHPTVKPVALMRWLVRLVTPPGGTVLDPFAGSGTTLVAATLEGFQWVGCEMTADYLPIIEGRVRWAEGEPPSLL